MSCKPVESTPSSTLPKGRFCITSDLDFKVVTIQGGRPAQGTPIIMHTRNHPVSKNQLWYFDHDGFIRSALNDFVFANNATGERLTMVPFGSQKRGHWKAFLETGKSFKLYQDGVGECLGICNSSTAEGAPLCSENYLGNPSQNWQFKCQSCEQ